MSREVVAGELKKAAHLCAHMASQTPYGRMVRLYGTDGEITVAGTDGSNQIFRNLSCVGDCTIDLEVPGREIKSATSIFGDSKTKIMISQKDDHLILSGPGSRVKLRGYRSGYWDNLPEMDQLEFVFDGSNPSRAFENLTRSGTSDGGSRPMFTTAVLMGSRAYGSKPGITVRASKSLFAEDSHLTPCAINLNSLWVLKYMADRIWCHADQNRIVVSDESGYAVLMRTSIEMAKFGESADKIFGSLTSVMDVQIPREQVLDRIVGIAGIFSGADSWGFLEAKDGTAIISASDKSPSAGEGAACREVTVEFPATSYGVMKEDGEMGPLFKVPVHLGRLRSFLTVSRDPEVMIRVMESPLVAQWRHFVHYIDSDLHECVGIPVTMGGAQEVLD